LQQIYALIDELEPIDQDPETYRPVQALYYWPLALSLALFALFLCADLWWRRAD
jgi:Ca-activated chloride channel family protein